MTNRTSDFQFQSVLLQSERIDKEVELRDIVSDLEIFEHLDKPYLTGKILLIDSENLLQEGDFLGGERITVAIKTLREDSKTVIKTFYIANIIQTEKVQDNVQTIVLSLIEDIGYISNLQVINKFYSGKVSDILNKISFNYLNGKEINSNGKDKDFVKLIVPNLDPLETFKWLTRKAKTQDGYPFYIYSVLTKDELQFQDLGTLLQTSVINADVPYRQNSAAARSFQPDIKRRTIQTHKFTGGANILDLVKKSLIGSKYEYIDSTEEKRKIFEYDVMKDLFVPLLDKSVLQQNQPNPPFSAKYKFNGQSFNELNSSYNTMFGGSNAYRTTDDINYVTGYNEEKELSGYKAKIIGRAMDAILRTEPLTMGVDGLDFLDGDKHSTIGNQLRVEIATTNPEPEKTASRIDKRKSGDYLIFATRHMFKREKYDLALTCVKLGNYKR